MKPSSPATAAVPPPIKLKLKLGGVGGSSPSSIRPPPTTTITTHDDWDEDDLLHSIDRDNERSTSTSTSTDTTNHSSNPTSTPTASKRRKPNPKPPVDATSTTPKSISTPSGLKLKLNLGHTRPSPNPNPDASVPPATPYHAQGRGRDRRRSSPPPSHPAEVEEREDKGPATIPTLPAAGSSSSSNNGPVVSTSTPKIRFNFKVPQGQVQGSSSSSSALTNRGPESLSTSSEHPQTQSRSTKTPKVRVNGLAQVKDSDGPSISTPTPTPRIKVKLSSRVGLNHPVTPSSSSLTRTGPGEGDGDGPEDEGNSVAGPGQAEDEDDVPDPSISTPSKPSTTKGKTGPGKKGKMLKFKTPSINSSPTTSASDNLPQNPSDSALGGDEPPTSTSTSTSTSTPSKPKRSKKGTPASSPLNSPGSLSPAGVGKAGKSRPKSKLREELGVSTPASGSGVEGEGGGEGKIEDGEGEVKREAVGIEVSSGTGVGAGPDDQPKMEGEKVGKQEDGPGAEPMDIKPDLQATEQQGDEYGADDDGRDGDEMDYGEDEMDLLSTPMDFDSPGGGDPSSTSSSPFPGRTPRGGKGSNRHKKPFAFRKKPLPHLLQTIIGNLRRKDAYGLFFDPVSLEEYPNYFEVIGGEDQAMDLGTMEGKVDRGEYRDMAEFESDVDKMINAAQKFNPDDTLVHREAAKVAQLAARQFVRFRGLVKTPSPSPERETPTSGLQTPGFELAGSVGPTPSNRSVSPTGTTYRDSGGSLERPAVVALQPRQMVPEGMLEYPPNSDIARCVGWYLTGGKRPRTKKEQRAKEKWDGTWREWNATGDRDLREADNIMDLFREGFTFETSGDKITFPRTVDWQDEAMNASEVWQPTPTLTGIISDEVVPSIPYRPIDHLDLGRYQNLAGSYGFPEYKGYDVRKFLHDLEVDLDSVWRDEERGDQTERPAKVVKDMCLGEDIAAEAYVRSIDAFVAGARGWVDESAGERKRKHEEMSGDDLKPLPKRHAAFAQFDTSGYSLGMPLAEYVGRKWRGGWLQAGMRGTVRQTEAAYRHLMQDDQKTDDVTATKKEPDELVTDEDIATYARELYSDAVRAASKRIPIALEIEAYGARQNGLDLACLLHLPSDFAAGGSAMGPPPNSGPGRAAWYEKSLQLAGQQIVDAAKRREIMGEEEVKGETELAKLTRLRLDLLSLAKNVPVYELRPMTPEEVDLLPPAVRGLIKVVPKS